MLIRVNLCIQLTTSMTLQQPQAAKVTCARKVEERKAELASKKQQLADVLQVGIPWHEVLGVKFALTAGNLV